VVQREREVLHQPLHCVFAKDSVSSLANMTRSITSASFMGRMVMRRPGADA